MRTFDENSCALSITNPRSLSPPNFAPEPINFRGGDGRSLLERSDNTIGGGSPESRDFPRDSGDSLNGGGGGGGGGDPVKVLGEGKQICYVLTAQSL